MTRQEHLLVILMEECAEVAQRASKALRFGLFEVQPGQELTNRDRICQEFADLTAAMNMLENECGIGMEFDRFDNLVNRKIAQVEKFLKYSSEVGTLNV